MPHIRSHRAPCSCFPNKVSLQLSSEQSVGEVWIAQLDRKRVPQARSSGCKSSVAVTAECPLCRLTFVYFCMFYLGSLYLRVIVGNKCVKYKDACSSCGSDTPYAVRLMIAVDSMFWNNLTNRSRAGHNSFNRTAMLPTFLSGISTI